MDMLCDLSVARAVASRRGGPLTRKARFRPSQAAPFINNQTINRTVKMLSSFGFAPTPRSRKAAWARKPAILQNRINNNRTVNFQVKARSQRGQDRALRVLQPFAGGGSGLTATRTIKPTVLIQVSAPAGGPDASPREARNKVASALIAHAPGRPTRGKNRRVKVIFPRQRKFIFNRAGI